MNNFAARRILVTWPTEDSDSLRPRDNTGRATTVGRSVYVRDVSVYALFSFSSSCSSYGSPLKSLARGDIDERFYAARSRTKREGISRFATQRDARQLASPISFVERLGLTTLDYHKFFSRRKKIYILPYLNLR